MKKFYYISTILVFCFFMACCGLLLKNTKPFVDDNVSLESPDTIIKSNGATAGAEPIDEGHKVILTSNDRGEGIGLGNPNSIGHGVPKPVSTGSNNSNPIKVVEIKNTKVIKQNTDLSEGRVVYKIPEKMKIRTTYKVLVRISKSKAVVNIYDSLVGTVMTSQIPVTETMEVKLIDVSPSDSKAFEIVNANSGEQIVEDGDTYTEWSWDVTPIKVGNSKLKIVVSVIRNNNKKDVVYEDTVQVEKDLWTQIKFFLGKYWQWIASTIVIPFIIWAWKSRKDKKEINNSGVGK